MKTFLTVMGLLTVIATPAFAQAYDTDHYRASDVPVATSQSATRAFAHAAPKASAEKAVPTYNVFGGTGWYSQDGW
jgi:hypothetical protein